MASTQTTGRSRRFCGPGDVEAGQPLETRPRTARVPDRRIWQGCGHQSPLITRKVLGRFAESAARSRLGAKFTTGVMGGWDVHTGILADVLNGVEPRPFWKTHAALEKEYAAAL